MEGVAYNSRWLFGYVERFTKQRLEPVRLLGGGAVSAAVVPIYADVLDRSVDQVADPMVAQLGMATIAGVALGRRTLDEVPGVLPPARRFEPDPARAARYAGLADEVPSSTPRARSAGDGSATPAEPAYSGVT